MKRKVWYQIGSQDIILGKDLEVIEHWEHFRGSDSGACYAVSDMIQQGEKERDGSVKRKPKRR